MSQSRLQVARRNRSILLYSPILPLRTGTADYMDHLLDRLRCYGVPATYVRVVVDSAQWPESSRPPAQRFSFEVVDYRSISDFATPDEFRVYFVANNEFHGYVHRALARLRRHPEARCISIIHDPACAMIHKDMSYNNKYDFSRDQFEQVLRLEFGAAAGRMLREREGDILPELFEYITHAQRWTIEHSSEIWAHSVYGALKLLLESNSPVASAPPFRVALHPHYDEGEISNRAEGVLEENDLKAKGVFRMGIFGWVAPSKRVLEVVRGMSHALDRLPPDQRSRLELIVVGKLPDPTWYNPAALAQELGLVDQVRFYGFTTAEKFRALIETCDCVFNLRFPSCGESSGAGAHARAFGVKLISTRYQAFSEEPADAHVTALPGFEALEIGAQIVRLFMMQQNQDESPAPAAHRDDASGSATMDLLLAYRLWSFLMEGRTPDVA